jgi:hypothetical protein
MASISGGGGNYISDGNIMEWLATQQDRIYGDLRDSMQSSEARAQFSNDLNDIKAALHAANDSPNHDFTQVDQKMQAFMQTYDSDPEFAELCSGLEDMVNQVHADTAIQIEKARKQAEYQAWANTAAPQVDNAVALSAYTGRVEAMRNDLASTPPQLYQENTLRAWDELIGGKLDTLGKNDQLTMIHIQQLKATIDQSSQFGSQFIASGDKTSSSIINNIA